MKIKIDENDEKFIVAVSDYLKYLSLMAVQKANSGHPGLPLGCAKIGVLLYSYFVKGCGTNPLHPNRDRFVLSAGHGSMLLYALNHIFGYDISMSDLTQFRQLHSLTAGHPEYEPEKGIETTTGPLGQGVANAVGLALEGKMLARRFSPPEDPLFDYEVYAIMGDGCAMEGVSNEAASLAGHLGLDNLTVIYDSNQISIDGSTDLAFTEDTGGRYRAQGWWVEEANSASLPTVVEQLNKLRSLKGKPKLLVLHTHIGEGLDKLVGTHKVHGSPAGIEEISFFLQNSTFKHLLEQKGTGNVPEMVQQQLDEGKFWTMEDVLSAEVRETLTKIISRRRRRVMDWLARMAGHAQRNPAEAKRLSLYQTSDHVSDYLRKDLLAFQSPASATRNTSAAVLKLCCDHLENIIGGSADLVGSTKATVAGSTYVQKNDYSGRNIAFGVREHVMGSIGNGLALSGQFIPFTSTFFTFFDYMKPAVRLAAIMKIKHLFIFTHDSIYVGEDGPTHQPIEHLPAIRLIPNLYTFRPCNDSEMAFAYLYFLENKGPVAIIGTRQNLSPKLFERGRTADSDYQLFLKGGYVFAQDEVDVNRHDLILVASGSEMSQAIELKERLTSEGKKVQLVSLPCPEILDQQEDDYCKSLFGDGKVPVFFIEASSHRSFKWLYPSHFHSKTMASFGASGNAKDVEKHFGFDAESLYEEIHGIL